MIAAPKTRQSLLSGEHKMFDAGKSAGPCRGGNAMPVPKTKRLAGEHKISQGGAK